MIKRRWLRAFRLWRRSPATDVDAEIRFHLEQRTEDLISQGLTPAAAAQQAETEFGDRAATRAELLRINERMASQQRRSDWRDAFLEDLRYVLRGLRRTPGFTAMVAITLALGLGANTALVAVLDRLLWRQPAGVPTPQEVKRLHEHYIDPRTHDVAVRSVFNYPEMRAIADAKPSAIKLAGFRDAKVRLGAGVDGRELAAVALIGDYFGVLSLQPAAGRFFSSDEARAETFSPVVVISHRLWQRDFNGSTAAIGQPLDLGSHRYTIIGVAPPSFQGLGLDASDVWFPMSTQGRWIGRNAQWYESRGTMSIRLITRIADEQSGVAITAAAQRALIESKTDSVPTAVLAPIIEPVWPDGKSSELTMATRLTGVSIILLFIACANVANLLLARGLRRRREIAVRLALGIGRKRLVVLLLMESVVISLIGGAAGFVIGSVGAVALKKSLLPSVTWSGSVYEWKFALFSLSLALITGVIAGLVPALRASNPSLAGALKAGTREGYGHRSRLRSGLVIAQAALSIVLITAAGVFALSFNRVRSIDTGYALQNILFASATVGEGQKYSASDIATRTFTAAERIRAIPGVATVGFSANAPMLGFGFGDLFRASREEIGRMAAQGPFVSYVSKEFFDASGLRVLSGRGFTDGDRKGAPYVMIVNETMARELWPNQTAVGQCLYFDDPKAGCREIVGVVSNANFRGYIEEPAAQYYIPFAQTEMNAPVMIVRARGSSASVVPSVRAVMTDVFGGIGPPSVQTISSILDRELQPRRLSAALYGAAGLLALIVAAFGVYSSVSYAVGQRMHEMGVRAALGARPAQIITQILGEGVKVVTVGVVIGIGLALMLAKAVSALLYNTSARDPVMLTAVSVTLLAIAVIACFVPAWRATRANPVDVLRAD